MSLLAPWLLAGLAAIGVPIVVHLVHREQEQAVRFPSLMFLRRIPYQSVRRQRIRHWPLLLLRCLAILLLVGAFARPFFPTAGLIANNGREVVVLLDRSYSMEYGDRWQRAVAAAKGVVNELEDGDRGAIVYFDGEAVVASGLTDDKEALHAAIDSARPTAGSTRYGAAFGAVQRVLGDTARPRREVALISDYQRAGWDRRELSVLPTGTVLRQVNLGDSATANVFVASVDFRYLEDARLGHERLAVTARLANHGQRSITDHAVGLEVDGRPMLAKTVNLPPYGVADVTFDGIPIPPAPARATIQVGADSLQRDNRFHFVLTRKRKTPVLLVESPRAGTTSEMFLSRALRIGDRPSFSVQRIAATALSPERLRGQQLVILNDVSLAEPEIAVVVDYVKQGGGLLVVLGGQSGPESWSASADQLMPRPSGAPVDRFTEQGVTLGFLDQDHPVFEVFGASRSTSFSRARFFRYWPVTAGPDDRELARFSDGHTALLERRVGAGRVLLWSSDLDGLWNNLPLQPVFLPVVRRTAIHAAAYVGGRLGGATVGRAFSPTELKRGDVPSTDSGTPSSAGQMQYVAIAPSGAQTRFGLSDSPRTLELSEQGFYEFKRARGESEAHLMAVNVNVAESDLTQLDGGLLDVAVAPRMTDAPRAMSALPQDIERRQSIWWYLVILALVLIGTETLLSNRLSRTSGWGR